MCNLQKFLASRSNNRGFSLVQVMVSVGIMGGLALTMMRMMEAQTKSQKTMELKSEQNDIKTIIKQIIANKAACEATFIGMSPGDDIGEIRISADQSVAPFARTGEKFKNANVYIKSMRLLTRQEEVLSKLREAAQPPINFNDGEGFGYGYLRVTFVKNIGVVNDMNKSHNFFGARETSVDIPIGGNFYDLELVNNYDEDKIEDACITQAQLKGVTCTKGDSNDRCWSQSTGGTYTDQSSGLTLYLGECRFFKDDSPFIACATNSI